MFGGRSPLFPVSHRLPAPLAATAPQGPTDTPVVVTPSAACGGRKRCRRRREKSRELLSCSAFARPCRPRPATRVARSERARGRSHVPWLGAGRRAWGDPPPPRRAAGPFSSSLRFSRAFCRGSSPPHPTRVKKSLLDIFSDGFKLQRGHGGAYAVGVAFRRRGHPASSPSPPSPTGTNMSATNYI